MKQFTAIYQAPLEVLEVWKNKPESERKGEEEKMRAAWHTWTAAHGDIVKNTIALGKTKRVSEVGTKDTQNGMMLSSYLEAESHEAATAIFTDHPHLQIPGATIEVMEIRQLTGM